LGRPFLTYSLSHLCHDYYLNLSFLLTNFHRSFFFFLVLKLFFFIVKSSSFKLQVLVVVQFSLFGFLVSLSNILSSSLKLLRVLCNFAFCSSCPLFSTNSLHYHSMLWITCCTQLLLIVHSSLLLQLKLCTLIWEHCYGSFYNDAPCTLLA
jgi:hypothetical protein